MQAQEVVTRALRMIGVGVGGEVLSDEDATDGLAILNAMLHSWALHGVDLGHVDLALTDELAVPDSHIEAVVHNLAVRAASELDGMLKPGIAELAVPEFLALKAAYLDIDDMETPRGLQRMPSQYWGTGDTR